MNLNRTLLEQYLDGELAPADVARVDQALRADAAAAALVAKLRSERALRVAALGTFEPAPEEARQLAGIWMDDFAAAPLGTIAPARRWWHRAAQIAAGLVIAAGSYYAGHATQPGMMTTTVGTDVADASTPYVVDVKRGDTVVDRKEFKNIEEAQQYADAIQQQPDEQPVQTAGGVF